MTTTFWHGVMPAITTPFRDDLTIDLDFLRRHAAWMVDAGCTGVVCLGSLGEGATLDPDEKGKILAACVAAVGKRVPVVAAISALSTAQAVRLAKTAQDAGCRGLMILPPYVHQGDWRETQAHFSGVLSATPLSSMLYNNPIAYGIDVRPEQVAELCARHDNLHAVKESSGDVRRCCAVKMLLGDRVASFAGLDDMIVEALHVGATGWVAGLVNALPKESVRIVELARQGPSAELTALHRWFLPLLRMDTVPKFVQLIKLVQQEVGMGRETVRPPRLPLVGEEREQALATIRAALKSRP